jgi:molybdate transport system permease protein
MIRQRGTRVGPVAILWIGAGLMVLFLAVPLLAMVIRAVEASQGLTAASLDTLRQAITLSFVTTAIAMTLIMLLGTPLAYLLARRSFRGKQLIDSLIDLPIVLPPAVAGIALLMAFGRRGVVGQWLAEIGITVGFTTAAVIMAQMFVAAPFYIRAAKGGFARIDADLETAAADLGATPVRVFLTITMPLALPGLAAGAVLAWARALGEFGATITFAGNYPGVTRTMPLLVYGELQRDPPAAYGLSLVLLVLSVAVLALLRERWLGALR